jgi:hypothetical protein
MTDDDDLLFDPSSQMRRSPTSSRAKNTDAACNALLDRLDGKVPQAVVGSDGEDPINMRAKVIARVIIDPRNPDAGNSDSEEVHPAAEPGEV